MRTELVGIETDARDPSGDEAGVLPCRDALTTSAAAAKQAVTSLPARSADVVIDRLSGVLGHLKANRQASLLLADHCSVDRISVRRDVFNLEGDDVATAQLAIDGEIEHRQIPLSTL